MPDLLFLDTETLGLDVHAPIWQLAAVLRREDGSVAELDILVKHDPNPWLSELPARFANHYRDTYTESGAVTPDTAVALLRNMACNRPTLIGAVPSFDAERIARQWLEPRGLDRPWHYHLIDVENLAAGFLAARDGVPPVPWKSDDLSRALGVNPDDFYRHTAMGDVQWVMAQWAAIVQSRGASR